MTTTYTTQEKEILTLKAIMESIGSMVNYEVLSLNHSDPDSTVQFPTRTHQQYFNIMLLDFLNAKIYRVDKKCLEALQVIIKEPIYNLDIELLKKTATTFQEWLDKDVEFEHDGETRQLWFSSINQKIALKITRIEFIRICGNISKHNPLGLDRQATVIKNIFAENNIKLEVTEALLVMGEFYEQFHDDLFSYHSSAIAEFLNNLRWAIYEYLQPLYQKSVEHYLDETHNMQAYRFNYPDGIENKYVKEIFLNLMNDVRSKPYIPCFEVTKHAKMKY